MNPPYPLWLPYASTDLLMKYKKPQQGMKEIYGVIFHTTNASKGAQTIARFISDWNTAQAQSAHFIIDRDGEIAQCRALSDVAWHMNADSIHYIGVELISSFENKSVRGITSAQMTSASRLIVDLANYFSFPIKMLTRNGKKSPASAKNDNDKGIGTHTDFEYTFCGKDAYWSGSKPAIRSQDFQTIVRDAASQQIWGY